MSEGKTFDVSKVDEITGESEYGGWVAWVVLDGVGVKYFGYEKQWTVKPEVGFTFTAEVDWSEKNSNYMIAKKTKAIKQGQEFQPPIREEYQRGVPTETPTVTQQQYKPKITPELLANNLKWCWDQAAGVIGEGISAELNPVRQALTATLFIQMARSSTWKVEGEKAKPDYFTPRDFLLEKLRGVYNNPDCPVDWKEQISKVGQNKAATEDSLLSLLLDSLVQIQEVQLKKAKEKAEDPANVRDSDIPF
jgi:hypothetical protein